ncbi:bifunctional diaminohydroxyphosphoribosylaminopyrimidine deaminase/5-amino-6-(5-phosphoribosylamino)uracil reductase RibD [Ruania suaedae]|uniref:bifunctional diaminohydroxyphosphoribosylaminopyrimidine deaminase/5-amino-6-(5-phosphoribosylamino)uracil reductase RibD n=1 Tax=Ruania suaedae TaxID=2897774 RepID=UPI001E4E78C1|nr:bifunctional diaminohydroxyphosphoribosylaminopyrimidine deaminase/5-amino-6-(5-phosphoribosylamino)uracil reductase RibD [Ruania suaedae]UFU03684.1 bifunctional diaminohydroxyphosphoribosylaminopyrimidine deaminase/5-amino-6-(5-phosphoribosylamino)uracil reductase RibD [Ruania suaedae]
MSLPRDRDHDLVVDALDHAIELSARGLGRVSPNPAVGCVILDIEGHTVGEGWHQRPGGPHAEVAAIADAAERVFAPDEAPEGFLGGCTAVVTLEPCPHTGRTGPCTEALLEAGVSRVVYALEDPLHGGGADVLRHYGVEVHGPGSALVPDAQARAATLVLEPWSTAQRTGRPHVTWKFAATLDGRSAAADGSSRWITGEQARADVHRLRDEADAVLIGAGTQRADDPQLTVRPAPPDGRQPLRVVLDPRGTTAADSRILDDAAPTLVLGVTDLHEVLAILYERDVRSVLLEGGPRLAGSFFAAGLVDRVVAYLAPALLGAGAAALADAGVSTLAGAHRLEPVEVTTLGADLRLIARPVRRTEP